MKIMYFNPTSTGGPGGYINYHMSGGSGGGEGGPGCGTLVAWIIGIVLVLDVLGKIFGH